MTKTKRISLPILAITTTIALVILLGITACQSGEKSTGEESAAQPAAAETPLSRDSLIPVFGWNADLETGVVEVKQEEGALLVAYAFDPSDPAAFGKEIGEDMAPKIQDFYKKFDQIDRVRFEILTPQSEETGEWRLFVSFVMTRRLVEETNWTDLLAEDLLQIALEVQYAD